MPVRTVKLSNAFTLWASGVKRTARERAALAWTDSVTQVSLDHVPDEVYRHVREHFDERQLVDLKMAIVAINSWNRLAISFRTPAGTYEPGTQHSARSQSAHGSL